MRKSGGGGGGAGPARNMISESCRETINTIREITGKQHSDEDIYSVLQDCSMDPDETAQKLLYLDTFHEVRSKRDRRKEVSGNQLPGPRGGRGNYSDDGRKSAPRREHGVNQLTKKGSSPFSQKANINGVISVAKSSTIKPNGSNLVNGSTIGRSTKDSSAVDVQKPKTASLLTDVLGSAPNQVFALVVGAEQRKPTSNSNHLSSSNTPTSTSSIYFCSSDPILAPSMTHHTGAVGTIKREVGSQQKAAEQVHSEGSKHISSNAESDLSKNEKVPTGVVSHTNEDMTTGKSKAVADPVIASTLSSHDGSLVIRSSTNDSHLPEESVIFLKVVSSREAQVKTNSQELPKPTIPNGHVRFPDHFKVPEALKNGLTFGSFDVNSGTGTQYSNCHRVNSTHAIESSKGTDETTRDPSSRNEIASSTAQVDHSDQPASPPQVLEEVHQAEGIASKVDSKDDRSKQEMMLIADGHQNHSAHIAPNYGVGIMSPMQGGHLVQLEGHESQARDISRLSSFVGETSVASSSPRPTPPPVQKSVAASPQPVFLRPPYPSSYFPYNPYFGHYFLPPPMHQFVSHNGLPQQQSTGNAYLTPASTGTGVKFPLPQFKPGTSATNPTPIGFPPMYGSYGSSPIGFNPSSAVNSGSSPSNEDLSASQLKESHLYTTRPLGEVSAWIPSPQQDMSSLQLNSLYHMSPQGQHLTFSHAQAGHGAFPPGIYPPVQAMAAPPSNVNPLMQQSQAISSVETIGPPPSAYHQHQLAQANWNSNY